MANKATGQGADVLQMYLNQIQHFQPLTFEEEQELARKWRDNKDETAAHKLMESYLRLVVKVALGFRGYGLPMSEVVQEGNIGLMHAIARFDPDRGFRLSTYAMWWIRASIQEYILNNWSLVKIGTTAAQKKLFFNLRRLRNQLRELSAEEMSDEQIELISKELDVKPEEVVSMEQRLTSNDQSLNVPIGGSGEEQSSGEWQDFLVEERPNQEETFTQQEILRLRRLQLQQALSRLDEREREIFVARRLNETHNPPTLEELSAQFGISRERVRQLEARAFTKVQKFMKAAPAA